MSPSSKLLDPRISIEEDPVAPGALDGVTIMRYAHVGRRRVSGGVEQYLRHLDHGLLQRHRLTILQTYAAGDEANEVVETENVGIGQIHWLPLPIRTAESRFLDLPGRARYICSKSFRQQRKDGQGQYRAVLSSLRSMFHHQGRHFRYKTTVLSDHLSRALGRKQVDLLVFHWLSYDTEALAADALKAGVPFVFINHFDNARLEARQTLTSVDRAAAIGTVSALGIPERLRPRCVNLSDAVDTGFFAPEKARPLPFAARPVILMPARIDAGKGHQDLMQAARLLAARNADFVVCFAGATDSEALFQELRRLAAVPELDGRIHFLGEKSVEEIRDWYGLSSMVVLPSHSEGLGRVLLEAQAMKKPVVAYNCGGVREAFLPQVTGLLAEKGDVQGLADRIWTLLQNEPERTRMGEHGRDFVSRNFSIQKLIERHEICYLRALSNRLENQ